MHVFIAESLTAEHGFYCLKDAPLQGSTNGIKANHSQKSRPGGYAAYPYAIEEHFEGRGCQPCSYLP